MPARHRQTSERVFSRGEIDQILNLRQPRLNILRDRDPGCLTKRAPASLPVHSLPARASAPASCTLRSSRAAWTNIWPIRPEMPRLQFLEPASESKRSLIRCVTDRMDVLPPSFVYRAYLRAYRHRFPRSVHIQSASLQRRSNA